MLGMVLEAGRGSLPFALIHGEALVACAAWALGEAGITVVDAGTPWARVREADRPLVLHDALCPMTPPAFLAGCVARAVAEEVVVVGVRPVTDTVKVVRDGDVGRTVDRDGLVSLASPVVVPAPVLATMARPPGDDLADLVRALRAGPPGRAAGAGVVLVDAPPEGRRVAGVDDVRLLEALTDGRRALPG